MQDKRDPGPLDSYVSGQKHLTQVKLDKESQALIDEARRKRAAAGKRQMHWNPNPVGNTGIRG